MEKINITIPMSEQEIIEHATKIRTRLQELAAETNTLQKCLGMIKDLCNHEYNPSRKYICKFCGYDNE